MSINHQSTKPDLEMLQILGWLDVDFLITVINMINVLVGKMDIMQEQTEFYQSNENCMKE